MNNLERLQSHYRMYSWIEEQAKNNKFLDEDYKRNDWETLTDTYPELLTFVEDLISHIEELEFKNTIYEEIKQERQRQDNKFGSQPRNLKPEVYLAILTEEVGEVARAIIEGDSENYREELIQIAAVCTAAVEEFDNGNALNEITSVCKPIKYRKDNE